jgi:hypothetical protein
VTALKREQAASAESGLVWVDFAGQQIVVTSGQRRPWRWTRATMVCVAEVAEERRKQTAEQPQPQQKALEANGRSRQERVWSSVSGSARCAATSSVHATRFMSRS